MTNFEIIEKPVITKFVIINNKEIELNDLLSGIIQILEETNENDTFGDYSLRDYELNCSIDTINILVELDLVKNYTGSRMANLYCIKNKEALSNFYDELIGG